MMDRPDQMTPEEAESLAIRGLQHIAGDAELLQRFLALTGISPQDLRDAAGSQAFLSGVLDFYMGDEATLTSFAASAEIPPESIAMARAVLSQQSIRDEEL